MSLWDDLFGTKSKATSATQTTGTQNETQNQTGTTTTNNTTTGSNSTTANTSQKTVDNSTVNASTNTSNLDPAAKAALLALIPGLAGNAAGANPNQNSDALKNIAAVLFNKGNGGDASALSNTIAAGQASARAEFGVGEGQQAAGIAQAIGSKGNTFSQLVAGKANADLATALNQIAADATLKSQAQSTSDLTGAASVLGTASATGATDASAALAPLLEALNTLKGADTTTTATQASTGESATNQSTTTLEQLLQQVLSNTNTNQTSTGNVATTGNSATQGKQTSTPGIVPGILSLF